MSAAMIQGPGHQGSHVAVRGTHESGEDVRNQNVTAIAAVANIIRSSLGPVGLDKVRASPPSTAPPRGRHPPSRLLADREDRGRPAPARWRGGGRDGRRKQRRR